MFLILPTIASPSYKRSCPSVLTVKSRANGRGIVGQQFPTLLDVTCCVRLHTPLHVVACCWEMLRKVWNLSNFEPTTPNISFDQWLPKYIIVRLHVQLLQQCWGHARELQMVYEVLWVKSFPRCSAGPNNHPFAHHCQRGRNNSDSPTLTPNIVGPLLAQLHRHPFTGL